MTKRPNPFTDYSPMLHKIHVTPKEVDMGVDKRRRMEHVYERTKTLLYSGSHRFTECEPVATQGDHQAFNSFASKANGSLPVEITARRHRYRQLCLDAFGNLQRNGEIASSNQSSLSSSVSCISCSRPKTVLNSKCAFCERFICDACQCRCGHCLSDFCSLCSFKLYSQREVSAICLSCSKISNFAL